MDEINMTKRRHIWLATAVLIGLSLLVTACAQSTASDENPVMDMYPRNREGYADISVEQLDELLERQDVTLVNVHVPYEGEIPQTDLFIPFDEIAEHVDELPAPDAPIVLYCRSGGMSTSAGETLASLGYTNVAEVDGGMRAWEEVGYELLYR
jgi:rhodanese-related sulfurtransferase